TIRCSERVGMAGVWGTPGGFLTPSADVDYPIRYTPSRLPHANSNYLFRLPDRFTPPGFLDYFGNSQINLQPRSAYAQPTNTWSLSPSPVDFDSIFGKLTFNSGIGAILLRIPIFDDTNVVEFNEDLQLQLYFAGSSSVDPNQKSLGYTRNCNMTIM